MPTVVKKKKKKPSMVKGDVWICTRLSAICLVPPTSHCPICKEHLESGQLIPNTHMLRLSASELRKAITKGCK